MDFLRCPECKAEFELVEFEKDANEVATGILHCNGEHFYPIAGGIPRMLPSSFADHWPEISSTSPQVLPQSIKKYIDSIDGNSKNLNYDTRTKANFSNEWDNHDIGGRTWTMELDDRVRWFFLDSIRIPQGDLNGKLMIDAGCGNGSQSVAYTEFGLEVIALDLSTGLEKGYEFRNVHPSAKPDKVHFIQADLQKPPLAPAIADIIHSAGVLHHTPNTEQTYRTLVPLLADGGTFYVWLYKYENFVTPMVNTLRAITTRIPAPIFATIADLTSLPFIAFCWSVNKLGLRKYETPDRREAALAVHDIFGAPYAHYHSFEEVTGWYNSVGITEVWPCNDDRRGFGVCGRLTNTHN
jgi:SAM-dependent methyltransferase/uncharacterized protein YbaR (Trm112 family)